MIKKVIFWMRYKKFFYSKINKKKTSISSIGNIKSSSKSNVATYSSASGQSLNSIQCGCDGPTLGNTVGNLVGGVLVGVGIIVNTVGNTVGTITGPILSHPSCGCN
ncbi:hypothetical protein ACTA71_001693 [Dictyostelium dimigraforme]